MTDELPEDSATCTGENSSPVPAVRLEGLTKHFGKVLACDGVDLQVERGAVLGLLGQNGAGKTTLMRMLTGLIEPDAGAMYIDGVEHRITDPSSAGALGIAMVHQHFSLIGALTIWENVTLGEKGRVDRTGAIRRVEEIAERYGLGLDPRARVEDLSTGEQQRVEIVKCLRRDPSVIILDEPTSVLTINESKVLFSVLRRVVREEGKAVVLISHKLDEILEATDMVTIMREGRVVRVLRTADATARLLAREMLGRDVSLRNEAASIGLLDLVIQDEEQSGDADPSPPVEVGSPTVVFPNGRSGDPPGAVGTVRADDFALRIVDACVKAPDGRELLAGLSLEIRPGEILGIAGVEGNGQAALGDLLSGVGELVRGSVEVGGRVVNSRKTGDLLRAGVGVIPEDRHACGCILSMSVAENLVLDNLPRVAPRRILRPRSMRLHAQQLIEEFDIVCPSPDTPLRSLSGGNQQKVIVAREFSRDPKVLVAAQPTRGLDVGAIDYINGRLRQAAADGVAVLLISAELEEVLALSDRIAVIHRGRIVGEMPRSQVDIERLGLMMGGLVA